MISAIWQYFYEEAKPRVRKIIAGVEFWVAGAIGIACGAWGFEIFPQGLKVGDLVVGLLTYASIALGFCLAGLTLALTLPDREFARKLATSRSLGGTDAYSDLLFVFSWTAICHWIAIALYVGALLMAGPQQEILPISSGIVRRLGLGVTAFVTTYGMFRFLITLIALSQVGRVYVRSINEN